MVANSAVKAEGYCPPQVPFIQPDLVHAGVLGEW
jgi:hypothetical protein